MVDSKLEERSKRDRIRGGDEDKRRDMIRVVEGNNYQRHYHIVHVHVRPRVGGVVLETSDEPLCCVVLGKRTT